MSNETDRKLKSAAAQRRYCNETKSPLFAPTDGICFSCNKNIYEDQENWRGLKTNGITEQAASEKLVTSCPHCNSSFID